MGTFFLIIIGVVLLFGVIGFLVAPKGEKEDSAKAGAGLGCSFLAGIMPTVFVIVIVVLLVKACT